MGPNLNSPNPKPMGSSFSSPNPSLDQSAAIAATTDPNPNSAQAEHPAIGSDQDPVDSKQEGEGEEVEEEEAECGFCLFMKGGGCKDEFIAWEKCVEDAEKGGDDIAEKCFEVTSLLKKCMDAHADYYEPILSAEKRMADSIAEEENENEKKKQGDAEEEEVEVVVVTESSEKK